MKTVETLAVTRTGNAGGSRTAPAGAKVAEVSQAAADAGSLAQVPPEVNSVKAAALQIDSYLKSTGREVEFRVDEDTGMTVVTVRATATGEVIRQIPNEEVLHLARCLAAGSGLLLDLKV